MRRLKPALIALAIAGMAAPAMAQVPRAPDGKPDLSGFWTHASLTPLIRSPANKTLVVNEAEAKRIAAAVPMAPESIFRADQEWRQVIPKRRQDRDLRAGEGGDLAGAEGADLRCGEGRHRRG